MIDAVIDWPNLVAGALLGFALALIPWGVDRRRARRERLLDTRAEWMKAAKQIELAIGPQTTAGDFYQLRVAHVVDRWRQILGPDDFVLMDRLESSYQQVEGMARLLQRDASAENEKQLHQALVAHKDAYYAFVNMSRGMQSESYNDVVMAEQRRQVRRDFSRHPLATWRRERRNRKARMPLAPPR